MSIKDSIYTSPDALRAKYLNPKNVLRNVDEQSSTNADAGVQASTVSTDTASSGGLAGGGITYGGITYGGGGGGGGGVYEPPACPALTEYVLVRGENGLPVPKRVKRLSCGYDWLYNPIDGEFNLLSATVIKKAECARVRTSHAEQIVSLTHPVITEFDDNAGTAVIALLRQKTFGNAVEIISDGEGQNLRETAPITAIEDAGIREVMRISLASGFIYCSGTNPRLMIAGHNNKPAPRGGGLGGEEVWR